MALQALDAVPVDRTALILHILEWSPAVKKERNDAGGFTDVPKVRDGVAGVEIQALAKFPGVDGKRTLKFTVYTPLPRGLTEFSEIRLVGPVLAHPWASGNKNGLWFEVQGIELVGSFGDTASSLLNDGETKNTRVGAAK